VRILLISLKLSTGKKVKRFAHHEQTYMTHNMLLIGGIWSGKVELGFESTNELRIREGKEIIQAKLRNELGIGGDYHIISFSH